MIRRAFQICMVFGFLLIITGSLFAQDEPDLFPGGRYDTSIPTPYEMLGHRFGERLTFHWEMEKFILAVGEKSDRVIVRSYGETYQGRKLYTVIISSPENLRRLEEIRTSNLKLTDPRVTPRSEAEQIAGWMPSIVWLGYNIHGNEVSAMEAAIRTVYQLAAGTDDVTQNILSNVVTIVDPVQNPDGHDRYAHHIRSVVSVKSHPQLDDLEHDNPWPGGRTNHYLFDLNRDFFLKTQIESQHRAVVYHQWMPHVFADLHEMGRNSTYFFAPPMDPYNEWATPMHFKWWDIIAASNAKAFDHFGWGYYTKESFDAFYPGYGTSYPSINGSIGMTYEEASSDGISVNRIDGTVLTLREASWHHFTTSMATLKVISENRKERILDFYDYFATALEEAKDEKIQEIILRTDRDPHITAKLISNMLVEGVEIERVVDPFSNKGAVCYVSKQSKASETFPAGTYIIRTQQPQMRLIRALLYPESPMSPEFLEEERLRQENQEPSHFYDISAWSMPLTYGIRTRWSDTVSKVQTERVTEPPVLTGSVIGGRAKQAYLVSYNTLAASKMLAAMIQEGYRVRISPYEFTIEGKTWPKGTLIVRANRNPESLHSRIGEMAREFAVDVTAVHTGLSDKGVDLGSRSFRAVQKPKIAIVGESPAASYSYGAMHYLFEREFGLDFTRIGVRKLADLEGYNVVVLPSGNYGRSLSKDQVEGFKDWIRKGGTVVAVSGSTNWLRTAEISKTKLLNGQEDPETGEEIDPWRITGTIVRVSISPVSFLSYGVGTSVNGLIRSSDIYEPFDDKFKDVGVVAPEESMVLSGWIWPESKKYLAGSGYLFEESVGSGKLILFTNDPNFRASYDGLNKLFLNAILLSPSF